jgi:hypothetical protein
MIPKKLFFSHVPKAAGTTMGRILKKNLGEKFYPYYGLYDRYMFNMRDVERILEFAPHIDAIASHLISLDLPWFSQRHSIYAISFVRDPVDRAISLFYYLQKLAAQRGGSVCDNAEEFFNRILQSDSEEKKPYSNAQGIFLGKFAHNACSLNQLQQHVDSGQLVIAPMDRFDDACLVLEKIHPDYLSDMAYPGKQNTAQRGCPLSGPTLEALRKCNDQDIKIYEWTQAAFDRQFKNVLGPNPAPAREDFKKRCAAVASDWIAEDSEKALNSQERKYFEHLKMENRRLRSENALLRSARDNRFLDLLPSPFLGVAGRLMDAVKDR